MSGSSCQAHYPAPNVVSATLADEATEGVYSTDVSGIGTYAATLSAHSWIATPTSDGGGSPYTLVVGAQEYIFTAADNSAANASLGASTRPRGAAAALEGL